MTDRRAGGLRLGLLMLALISAWTTPVAAQWDATASPEPRRAEACAAKVAWTPDAPSPDCLEALGIETLHAGARDAWLSRYRLAAQRWLKRCQASEALWKPAVGNFGVLSRGDRLCRDAFVRGEDEATREAAFRRQLPIEIAASDASAKRQLKQIEEWRNEKRRRQALATLPPPRLVSAPDLADFYPATAMRNLTGGRAVAECTLDRQGRARDCRIVTSSGSSELDVATLRVLGVMRWEPTVVAGEAVERPVAVPLRWTPPRP